MTERAARAETYRNKAEKARAVAEAMKDSDAKRTLLGVAKDYILMAEMLERLDWESPKSALL